MSNIDKNYEDFLKSLQEDNTQNSQEAFPFSEDFDIENFIKTTETSAQMQEQKPISQDNSAPTTPSNSVSNNTTVLNDEQNIQFEQNEDKNYSLKRLEEKLSDLQQKFNETNAAKEEESAFAAELNKQEEAEPMAEPIKSDEEFFSNISSAIHTLKGSLDNIVNTRLRYEENLIRQDQTLIARLREKTTRLKAINLALNSEVKRAKSEKLEYLRRSAEQTKELLSLRMQLSHAEERSKQGDFKISNLEQQITLLTQEKSLLDEEISKIRQEKLNYLQSSAEQTRNIMELRHQLAAKEEALKQEEIKTNFLDQQLKTVETEYQALKQQTPDSEVQKTLRLQKEEIESLTTQLNQSRQELAKKTEEVTSLRQQLLNLQFAPEQSRNEAAALAVKQEEMLEPLKISQEEHERKISMLRAEQSAELQRLRTQALQEENALRGELQRAEAKYQQESTFVNTLKAEIKTLEENLAVLERENGDYKNQSETLTKEIASIKENNRAEIANLKETLKRAQNSYEKQQEFYNTLETQYQNTQREKYYLGEELKKAISQKDNALMQSERYLSEIEKIKSNQNDVNKQLKNEIQNLLETRNNLQKEIETLKQNPSVQVDKLQQAQNSLHENNASLSLLKAELAALLNSKEATDKALLEARQEKYNLISKLAEQTEQLNTFQTNYQNEIAVLAQEKEQAQTEASIKITNLENKITENQGYITSLISKIQELEQEKNNLAQQEENQRLAEELKNKTAGNKALAEEIQAKNLEIQKLNQELEKAQKIFSQDTVLLEELKAQYSKLQERTDILQTELAKANEEKLQIEQERDSYKAQVEDLQHQLENVKEELKQGQEFTKQLTEQVNKLKTVNTALNAALVQAQNQKIEALNQTAQQTQEILELKEQLKQAQTKFLEFEQGTVKLKEEYAAKIQELEEELKRVSAVCVAQTKEINEIKTDNERLKTAAEEKLLLQNRFNALQQNANLLSEELNVYKERSKHDALIKAKSAALTAQLDKVNQEKEELKVRLNATQAELKAAAERELQTNKELLALHKTLSENNETISKLKAQIVPLMRNVAAYKAAQTIRKEAAKPASSVQPLMSKVSPQAAKETPKPAMQIKPATLKTPLSQKVAAKPVAPVSAQKAAPMPAPKKINILEETSEDINDDTFEETQTEQTNLQTQKQAAPKVATAVEPNTTQKPVVKAKTQIDILADYNEDENTNATQNMNSVFNDGPNSKPLEEVNLPEQEMDLSAIFGDEVKPIAQPQQAIKPVNNVVVEEVKQTDVSQIMKQRIAKKQKVMDELKMTVDENAVTDHSIRRSVVSRHPHLRNPVTTLEKGQEYSDFLKKTKSMFYRIKWSLFKD